MRDRPALLSLLAVAFVFGAAAVLAEEPAWVFAGPDDVGFIYDLKAADGVGWAATPAGIYRSVPSGQGWEVSGHGNESVSAIAVGPGSPIYALVGEGGLAVSRDSGDSWIRLAPSGSGLSAVAVDPESPSAAYLASNEGVVWRTTDSGATWRRVSATGLTYIRSIAFDPRDNALVLLGSNTFNGSITVRRSRDGGATFTTDSIPGHSDAQWFAIGSGAPGSSRFYASIPGFVCRTTDGAATWTCSSVSANVNRIVEVPASSAGATPAVVATTDRGLFVSADGGVTWAAAGAPLAAEFLIAAAYDAASGAVFAGTDSGIYRSTDRAASWSWHGQGLRSSSISALAVDPGDPSKLLASTSGFASNQGPGLFRSSDEGQSWSHLESSSAPSGFYSLALDSSAVYGVANGTVYRSRDAGDSWTTLQSTSGYPRFVAKDPRSPALWASADLGVSRSDDGGDTWHTTYLGQEVYNLVFDSHDPSTLYAGSYFDISYGYYSYPEGGSIFVSRDLGATWSRTEEDLGSPPTALAADPFAGGVVYAGTAVGVLRSSDAGQTWSKSPVAQFSVRNVTRLVADPARPGQLFAAADGGIYRSRDGGSTWLSFGQGLETSAISDLAIAGGGRRLVVGTFGAGIYELALGEVGPSFPCVASAERLCLIGGRYALDLIVQGRNQWSAGAAHALSDRAGYFGFPSVTGDAGFPEVVVKMLPAGALGPDGATIFHSSLTSLTYALTLTDTVTGEQHVYSGNGGGVRCGGVDHPFPDAPEAVVRLEAGAAPADAALSLLDHRFTVTVHARHPTTGRESNGFAVAADDRWGYFSMPDVTGDPVLPEVIVKMVDFRAISGKFWVFYTGLTGFDYTLTVTDTATGAVQTYESTDAFCGAADTAAFSD